MTPGASHSRATSRPRLAVFISGSGRTLINLADRCDREQLPATVALVVASRPCRGAELARARGLPVVLDPPGGWTYATLTALLREHDITLVVLAGYLKLLPISPALAGRALNIHPALLPDFGGPGMYGHHVHAAVIAAKRTTSGCTVHECSDQYDRGPILAQAQCPVDPADTPDTLAARVFALELDLYPRAIAAALARLGPNPAAIFPHA